MQWALNINKFKSPSQSSPWNWLNTEGMLSLILTPGSGNQCGLRISDWAPSQDRDYFYIADRPLCSSSLNLSGVQNSPSPKAAWSCYRPLSYRTTTFPSESSLLIHTLYFQALAQALTTRTCAPSSPCSLCRYLRLVLSSWHSCQSSDYTQPSSLSTQYMKQCPHLSLSLSLFFKHTQFGPTSLQGYWCRPIVIPQSKQKI